MKTFPTLLKVIREMVMLKLSQTIMKVTKVKMIVKQTLMKIKL